MVVSADMNREPFFSPPQPQGKKKKNPLSSFFKYGRAIWVSYTLTYVIWADKLRKAFNLQHI